MKRIEAVKALKPYLLDYVNSVTEKSKGQSGNYNCPICDSGKKKNKSGAFSVFQAADGPRWHCHSCQRGGDLVELIARVEDLPTWQSAVDRGAELFGIPIDEYTGSRNTTAAAPASNLALDSDFTEFYKDCAAHIEDTDYLTNRGISLVTQKMYGIGFCKEWKSPKSIAEGKNPPATPRIIIPTSPSSYFARVTGKTDYPEWDKMNVGHIVPFNIECLKTATQPIYVVEGGIDCLSILEVGGQAVGLGSTSMVNKFLEYVDEYKPTQPFIAALDNDGNKNTAAAQQKLVDGLRERGCAVIEVNPSGNEKDPNDALVKDRASFEFAIETGARMALLEVDRKKDEDKKLYQEEFCAQNSLGGIMKDIIDGNKEGLLSTGYRTFDRILDGGLDKGLVILGSISSLGKTTFCLNLCANIAEKSGRDILIFSLEMSSTELICKLLSRQTLLETYEWSPNGPIFKPEAASSNRNIYRRYDMLSTLQKETLNAAESSARKYLDHIYIIEGMGDVGVMDIRSAVERHIETTGNTPVVLVDYVQILAPYDTHYSDKQNVDKSVVELKRISRDFDALVIGVSSFNRENYTSPASMAAFKESGSLEYGCDYMIAAQINGMDPIENEAPAARSARVARLMKQHIEDGKNGLAQRVEFKLLKNRNGSRDNFVMSYYPRYNAFIDDDFGRFEDMEPPKKKGRKK